MSLILQALKKAEAERALGQVPSMHATLAEEAAERPPRSGRRALAWSAGLALVVAVAAWATYALWLQGRPAPIPPSASVSVPPRVGESAAPKGPPVRQPVATPAVQASAAPDAIPTAPAATPVAPAPATAPGPQAAPAPAPAAAPAAPRPMATVAPAPATAAKAREAPPQRLDELPAAARRLLPPLAVGGAIHAERAADRMVILDGEVRREGDLVAPDLVVERIEARSVVLRHRGQALRVPF